MTYHIDSNFRYPTFAERMDDAKIFYCVSTQPPGWESWNWRKRKKYTRNGWLKHEWAEGKIDG